MIGMIVMSTTTTPAHTDHNVRYAAIDRIRSRGDRYGHLGIALVARELAYGYSDESGKIERGLAAAIVAATGYDKGNVSRIGKVIRTDSAARSAIRKIAIRDIIRGELEIADGTRSADSPLTPAEVYAIDTARAYLVRQSTAADNVGSANSDTATAEDTPAEDTATAPTATADTAEPTVEVDPAAMLHEWLSNASDAQYEARVELVMNILAQVESERSA